MRTFKSIKPTLSYYCVLPCQYHSADPKRTDAFTQRTQKWQQCYILDLLICCASCTDDVREMQYLLSCLTGEESVGSLCRCYLLHTEKLLRQLTSSRFCQLKWLPRWRPRGDGSTATTPRRVAARLSVVRGCAAGRARLTQESPCEQQ